MALKDISTNLENYKFGMSDPEQIDTQKAIGVDFFDNQQGGVIRGFTTNVVAGEHQTEYIKYYEGTPVAPRTHSGTFYADLNPIANRSSIYRDESGNYILPDTGVNTNPPGTQSGIMKFTPPQITLNLEDGFSNEPFSVSARPSDSPTLLDRITGLTSTTQYTDFTGLPWDFRAPKRIIQTATDNQPGITWTFENSPNQQFTETLDGTTHSALVNTLLTFEPDGDLLGQFTKVPSGLNEQNQFGVDTFRNIANTGPHEGLNLHPILLRPITSDRYRVDIDDFGGVLSFGVPELDNTYKSTSIADKFRLSRVLEKDKENGEILIGKQEELQNLNTFVNTRILQPFSIIGMKSEFGSADNFELTPFYTPQRHKSSETFTQRRLQLESFLDDTGMSGTAIQQEDIFTEELVERELEFPGGTGQNSLSKLFGNGSLQSRLIKAYPNKYQNIDGPGEIKSSAPLKINDGVPSFKGNTLELAASDANKITSKPGGNFNSGTPISNIEKYATLSYGKLNRNFSYSETLMSPSERLEFDGDYNSGKNDNNLETLGKSAGTVGGGAAGIAAGASVGLAAGGFRGAVIGAVAGGLLGAAGGRAVGGAIGAAGDDTTGVILDKRQANVREKAQFLGNQGSLQKGLQQNTSVLGVIKGNTNGTTGLSDRINMLRPQDPDKVNGEEIDLTGGDAKDFIKFRFYDVIGHKYIIMRAILSGITDAVTADYSEEKYMGRPDKLYVYKGADRDVGFTFKVYPKTKQEFPVLMEKLDYVIGLCYPTFSETNRMKSPYIELTIGDMFVDTPGILKSVNVTVEDNTTWEIDDGLQFPKHITVQCQFRYIGSHKQSTTAQHYGGVRPHRVENPTQEENANRIINQYLGNGPIVSGILDFTEDPEDFVEDSLESLGNTISGWFG